MSRLMIAIFMLAAALPAGATGRYSSPALSCAEIAEIIETEGAAIFRYPSPRKPGLTLYDRYVRDGSFCTMHQTIEKVQIPSNSADQCPVKRCRTLEDSCEGLLDSCF